MTQEKTILCFGDSNTWGADPSGGPRFDRSTRWPCVMQAVLGEEYYVVEEGLCGRTTVWDDPIEGDKNGVTQLVHLLNSHSPLDLLIIMLGTNDLKNRFSVSALDVANSIGRLVDTARNNANTFAEERSEILVICPPPFADLNTTDFKDMFVGGEEKSYQLAATMAALCSEKDVRMMNAGNVIQSSPVDGIHFEAVEHGKLGHAIAEEVREIF